MDAFIFFHAVVKHFKMYLQYTAFPGGSFTFQSKYLLLFFVRFYSTFKILGQRYTKRKLVTTLKNTNNLR